MKRRNFLAALLALPFAAKQSRATWSRLTIKEDIDLPYIEVRLYDANDEAIRRLKEALRLNTPSGWRFGRDRYMKPSEGK